MSYKNLNINTKLVPANHLKVALDAQRTSENAANLLLEQRKLPEDGWCEKQIEDFLNQLSALDSNNFANKIGMGEREGRIISKLVARRHYNFSHGIGRSGNLLEPQPKAAGSTLLSNLTNELCLDLLRGIGLPKCQSCFVLPMATGMALSLCFLALKKERPRSKYIIWSRIDQKSCFKSITTVGMEVVIIQPILNDDNTLQTNVEGFKQKLAELSSDEILCLFTTTSCFAPRNCDDIISIGKLAKNYNIPHVVNNAYGLQSTYFTNYLSRAAHSGRVDLFVQSTDKNLMVPVGGAIVAGFDKNVVLQVAKCYAGRSSSCPTLDTFMTLMSLGKVGYINLVNKRKINFEYLKEKLIDFAKEFHEQVIPTNDNPISIALTLTSLDNLSSTSVTEFGSMLFIRGVSGVRVVGKNCSNIIDGYNFENWGSHSNDTRAPYMTVAASIGIEKEEIDTFLKKLKACWRDFCKRKLN